MQGRAIQGLIAAVMSSVARQAVSERMQTARLLSSACIAIAVGMVSLSYGIASMGIDTLQQFAREAVERRPAAEILPDLASDVPSGDLLSA